MSKSLCDMKGTSLDKLPEWFWQELRKPKFVCSKCLRAAKHKKVLCSPERIPDSEKNSD